MGQAVGRYFYLYRATASGGLARRTGPAASYAAAGAPADGSLALVVCRQAGSKVSTTSVWSRLENGRRVSDHYVADPSDTTYGTPVPRC